MRAVRSRAGQLEVDAHHDAAGTRSADLGKPCCSENLVAADVEFAPGDLFARLGEHAVSLEGPRAAVPGEVDCGPGQGICDATLPETRSGDETGNRPDSRVGFVFCAAKPGCAFGQQMGIHGTRFNGAPAHWLVRQVGDQPGGRFRFRSVELTLFPEPLAAHFGGKLTPLRAGRLVPLALAAGSVPAEPENRLQVCPGGLMGGHDPKCSGIAGCCVVQHARPSGKLSMRSRLAGDPDRSCPDSDGRRTPPDLG